MLERPHLPSMHRGTAHCMIRPARRATRAAEKAAATASIREIRDTVSDLPDAVWRMRGLDSLDPVERITPGARATPGRAPRRPAHGKCIFRSRHSIAGAEHAHGDGQGSQAEDVG